MAQVTRLFEKLGLLKVDGDTGASSDVANPDQVTAQELTPTTLANESRPVDVAPIDPGRFEGSSLPAEAVISFDDIYARAGVVAPRHGFTIDKLIEMTSSEEFRGMDRPTMAKVIAGMLKMLPGGPVPVEDIVQDAVSRDRALDAFERFMAGSLQKLEEKLHEENRALQDEIDQVYQRNNQSMVENKTRIQEEKTALESWRRGKEAEENRLFEALRPFVNENPVTRGPASPTASPTSSSPAPSRAPEGA